MNGKTMENQTTIWSESLKGRKATVEQILASEKNKSKGAGLCELQQGI